MHLPQKSLEATLLTAGRNLRDHTECKHNSGTNPITNHISAERPELNKNMGSVCFCGCWWAETDEWEISAQQWQLSCRCCSSINREKT